MGRGRAQPNEDAALCAERGSAQVEREWRLSPLRDGIVRIDRTQTRLRNCNRRLYARVDARELLTNYELLCAVLAFPILGRCYQFVNTSPIPITQNQQLRRKSIARYAEQRELQANYHIQRTYGI